MKLFTFVGSEGKISMPIDKIDAIEQLAKQTPGNSLGYGCFIYIREKAYGCAESYKNIIARYENFET